eukprot:TRINITY_DN2653_c0_g1_i2.p1 TRINITY_DN2653_c0_g1~~TRINITY_DN2653_c0_g1_i2.p1  ORF type:complete len:367 (+),score=126.97 TRINITY_DN2653_c0_g1_i2:152-1252(+)
MQVETSEAEVFETSDCDESEPLSPKPPEADVTQGDDKLEVTALNPQGAFEKFAGRTYAVHPAGLSDSLVKNGLYDPVHMSILGQAGGIESPQQRLLRLQHEVKELGIELGAAGDGANAEAFPSDVMSEISELARQLEAMQTPGSSQGMAAQVQLALENQLSQALAEDTSMGASSSAVYELFVSPTDQSKLDATSKVAELEQRVAFLEECIGSQEEKGGSSLVDCLNSLERKVELMDTAKMDVISRKTQALSQHMAKLLKQKQTAAPSSEQEAQIQHLYDTMRKWEGVAKQVPGVVARLRTLQELHSEGSSMAERMQTLESSHADMSQRFGLEASKVGDVEASLKQNVATISENMKALEQRLAGLGK